MSADLTAARAQAFSLPAVPVPGERADLDGVTLRGLALCIDCVQAAYYPGEVASALEGRDAEPMTRLAGYEVSLDTDGDGDTLGPWFTWGGPGSCNGCDTRLGGDRYTASAWRPVSHARAALLERSYPVRDRVAVASWEGTERPGDLGDQVRPAVELHAAHNLSRKAYEVSLYAVTYIERDGYRMTRFTVRPGALVRLASIPAARMSGARLVALRDEWAGHLSRALEGEAGPVSPEAVAWVREVTA